MALGRGDLVGVPDDDDDDHEIHMELQRRRAHFLETKRLLTDGHLQFLNSMKRVVCTVQSSIITHPTECRWGRMQVRLVGPQLVCEVRKDGTELGSSQHEGGVSRGRSSLLALAWAVSVRSVGEWAIAVGRIFGTLSCKCNWVICNPQAKLSGGDLERTLVRERQLHTTMRQIDYESRLSVGRLSESSLSSTYGLRLSGLSDGGDGRLSGLPQKVCVQTAGRNVGSVWLGLVGGSAGAKPTLLDVWMGPMGNGRVRCGDGHVPWGMAAFHVEMVVFDVGHVIQGDRGEEVRGKTGSRRIELFSALRGPDWRCRPVRLYNMSVRPSSIDPVPSLLSSVIQQ